MEQEIVVVILNYPFIEILKYESLAQIIKVKILVVIL